MGANDPKSAASAPSDDEAPRPIVPSPALEARLRALGDARHTIADDPLATVRPGSSDIDTSEREAYESLVVRLREETGDYYYAEFAETLGQGAMGMVRVAVQPRLDREVAVKVLRDDHKTDASTLRLLQEAWVTGILEHPNIVPVHEIVVDPDGFPQVVLKRIHGRRWTDVMHDPEALAAHVGATDSFEWNIRTLMTVAKAVQHAHRRGIVHRDIKPENVMVGEHGDVYVVDWGIAVSTRVEDRRRIQFARDVREMSGTPAYMSPEQVQPVHPISPRTDVYLLGATLYEIVVGHAPHRGDDLMDLVRTVLRSDPPYPTDAPPELVAIARRAMAPDPEDRFASADELREALRAFLEGRGSARLCYEASMRLTELEELCADDASSSSTRRARLYDLLGACRFGFQQALKERADNEVARAGLSRAAALVARFELAQGNVDAAERLTLEGADPDLLRDIERAKRKKNRRAEALEALRRDRDPRVGQRARAVLAAILGSAFTFAPLLAHTSGLDGRERLLMTAFGTAMFLLIGALLALWKRREMTASALNRGLLGAIFLILLLQIVIDAGVFIADADPWVASAARFIVWSVVTAMVSMTLRAQLWWSSVAYLFGFFGACVWPHAAFPIMSIANLVFLANALWAWWPRAGRRESSVISP